MECNCTSETKGHHVRLPTHRPGGNPLNMAVLPRMNEPNPIVRHHQTNSCWNIFDRRTGPAIFRNIKVIRQETEGLLRREGNQITWQWDAAHDCGLEPGTGNTATQGIRETVGKVWMWLWIRHSRTAPVQRPEFTLVLGSRSRYPSEIRTQLFSATWMWCLPRSSRQFRKWSTYFISRCVCVCVLCVCAHEKIGERTLDRQVIQADRWQTD